MKFTMPVTFEIDPTKWAIKHGLPNLIAAAADIRKALDSAAATGTLAEAVTTSEWPLMRNVSKVAVGRVTQG